MASTDLNGNTLDVWNSELDDEIFRTLLNRFVSRPSTNGIKHMLDVDPALQAKLVALCLSAYTVSLSVFLGIKKSEDSNLIALNESYAKLLPHSEQPKRIGYGAFDNLDMTAVRQIAYIACNHLSLPKAFDAILKDIDRVRNMPGKQGGLSERANILRNFEAKMRAIVNFKILSDLRDAGYPVEAIAKVGEG